LFDAGAGSGRPAAFAFDDGIYLPQPGVQIADGERRVMSLA
jgi:hypothetical protein